MPSRLLPMVALFSLLNLISDWWFIAVTAAALTAWWLYFTDALGNEKDRKDIEQWLKRPWGGKLYADFVNGRLDWLERLLSPSNVEDRPKPRPAARWWHYVDWLAHPMAPSRDAAVRVGQSAFGWSLFDVALRLAVAYPLLLLVVTWAITGAAGRIGELVVLPADPAVWVQLAMTGALLFYALSLTLRRVLPNRARLVFQLVAFGFAVAAIFAVPTTGAFLVAVLVAIGGPGAFAVAGAVALAVAIAATFPVAAVFAATIAFAVTFAATFAGSVAVPVVFALSALVGWMTRSNRGLLGYVVLVLGALALVAMGALIVDPESTLSTTWLVFLGVFPLVNAVFDYLSMGLTRLLIRSGARHGAWALLSGILDVAAAAIFFTGLGCALILVTHGMNMLAGSPLLDLQTLFTDLRDPDLRGDYWWLYATIFSTLIPTFLHLAASAWSMIALIPRRPKGWVLAKLPKVEERTRAKYGAALGLTLMATFATILPLFLIVWGGNVLYHLYPEIGGGYLSVFESFARWLGAAVEPGPLILET